MNRQLPSKPGFWTVFFRELRWLKRRPLLVFFSFFSPLLTFFLLASVFSQGIATSIHIGLLDLDGSATSRKIIQRVNSTPDVKIVYQASNMGEARQKLFEGAYTGLLYIPHDFEQHLIGGKQPEIVYFSNAQFMSTANFAVRGVSGAVNAEIASIIAGRLAARGTALSSAEASVSPIVVQTHGLFNPAQDFRYFLLAALLPTLLQLAIGLTSVYTTSLDRDVPGRLTFLRRIGDGEWSAFCGKFLPYTLMYASVMAIGDAYLTLYCGMPVIGDPVILAIATVVFIVACQLIGALIGLILSPLNVALGLVSIFLAPAFSFMGVSFPRAGMGSFAYYVGALLPATHFMSVRMDQTIRGAPLIYSIHSLIPLFIFCLVLGLLIFLTLRRMRRKQEDRSVQPRAGGEPAGAGAGA